MAVLAAPLVIPFAEALGLSVAILGMDKVSDKVNQFIQDNPEESMKIFQMIMPAQGIANALKNKSSEDVEEVEETEEVTTGSGVEERIREILREAGVEDADNQDLTDLPKDLEAKVMSGIAKSSTNKQEDMKEASLIIGLRGPGKEKKEMIDDVAERYDEGGIEEITKPKYEGYKKFIRRRKADGGSIGIEVLFEEKKPRKNFFMGGPALDGQALAIYNSMNAYGFSDQAIANALEGQGLYTPSGSSTPETTAPNIINQQIQRGGDDFSVYNPDPNKIKPFKPMGINFQNQKPSALSTGIAKMMDNPLMKAVGFAMNPPLAFAKGILSKAGSMMPVNERSIMENLAGNTGVRVDDIGRIVNTGKYNTPENVMAGYNLSQVTDKTFTDRIDTIGNTLQDKYGLSKEQVQGLVDGTLSEEEMAEINELGFNKTMGKTTNLITQIRNVKLAQDNIMNQKSIAAQMAEQQRKAKEAADALAIQQSGLTDLGNIQMIQQYTGKPLSAYRMSVPASQRNYTGGDTNPNPSTPGAQDSFSNKSGMGRTGYGEGGLATMFKEKR